MADLKNRGTGKKTPSGTKSKPSSVLNRSLTVNSAAAAAAAGDKPLYNLCNSHKLQRNASVKGLHGSMVSAGNSLTGKVRKLCAIFESPKHNSLSTFNSQSSQLPLPKCSKPDQLLLALSDSSNVIPESLPFPLPDSSIRLPGTEDRIVIYFTSLRGIRRTFQDCHSIRMIFRGFRVNLDERDVSMDAAYRKELQKLLGENNVSLPQVFVKGKYVGGAEPIKQLLEYGELGKMVKGLPLRSMKPCDACGDVRFIPCLNCSGSRKVFDEDEEEINKCPDCNENGLLRCPLCSS